MKNKLLRTTIAALTIAALPIGLTPAFAATIDQSSASKTSGDIPVTATIGNSYTVTIPDSYSFGTIYKTLAANTVYSTNDNPVTLSNVLLDANTTIDVSVDPISGSLTGPSTATAAFTMYTADGTGEKTAVTAGGKVISAAISDTTINTYAGLNTNDSGITAVGSYSSKVTFTVSTNTI